MHQTVHIFLLAFLLLVSNFEPIYFDDWHITLTENPKPEIVQEVAYDPWGLVMQDESYFKPEMGVTPPSGAGGLLLFNGKELQTYADLHLYDYHWRQYDPQLGRWHSPDPADQFHGLSGYAYCANNPVMLTDPDGRIVWFVPVIIGAVVGAYAGASVHSGSWNPAQWKSDWWKGAVVGAFVGAAAGVGFSAVMGATGLMPITGMTTTTLAGKTVSTVGWKMALGATKAMGFDAAKQLGKMYLGMQNGFDWGSLPTSAIGSLAGDGLGYAFGLEKINEALDATELSWFEKTFEKSFSQEGFVKGFLAQPATTLFEGVYEDGKLDKGFADYFVDAGKAFWSGAVNGLVNASISEKALPFGLKVQASVREKVYPFVENQLNIFQQKLLKRIPSSLKKD